MHELYIIIIGIYIYIYINISIINQCKSDQKYSHYRLDYIASVLPVV